MQVLNVGRCHETGSSSSDLQTAFAAVSRLGISGGQDRRGILFSAGVSVMLRKYCVLFWLLAAGSAFADWTDTCTVPFASNWTCSGEELWQQLGAFTQTDRYLLSRSGSAVTITAAAGTSVEVPVCPEANMSGGVCLPYQWTWGVVNFAALPPPPPPDPLVCVYTDSETACLTRRVNALIEQVSPAEPYDAISGFGFFSLTMGGVLFTYFFSIGIGLIFKAVKQW